MHDPRARRAQGLCGGRDGRARRVDVVDEDHAFRNEAPLTDTSSAPCPHRGEGAADIASAGGESETGLARHAPRPCEQRYRLELPSHSKLSCEALGGMHRSAELAHRIGRDIRDGVHRRTSDVGGDEVGGEGGHPAEAVLLPRPHEVPCGTRVDDGGTRRGEGKPAPVALAAPSHRPGGRGAAERAARRCQDAQSATARVAEQIRGRAAGDASPWEEWVEQPRSGRYAPSRHVSVTSVEQECAEGRPRESAALPIRAAPAYAIGE
jgi:hypothetical protein